MSHITNLAEAIHKTAVEHGFWTDDRNFGEMIALMHSELSEALEEHRAGRKPFYLFDTVAEVKHEMLPQDYLRLPEETKARLKPEGAAVELLDCVIRILDTLYKQVGDDIEAIMQSKMQYNQTREFMHGKKY